jgi:hypothetical protein
VKTVRFSKVIETCGKPDIHLLLIQPAKDKTLQAAIKSDRVMTLYQESGGTDHGIVGFEEGRSRQFLLFPKPLKPFLGQRIVGIKYELLEDTPVPREAAKKETVKQPDEQRSELASALLERASGPLRSGGTSTSPKITSSEPVKRADQQIRTVLPKPASSKPDEVTQVEEKKLGQEKKADSSEDKLVKFQRPQPEKPPAAEGEEIREIKRQVREAMDALEQGKQVVAFNLLKRIVD